MNRYTLTIVLNKDCDKVLMCFHNKQKLYNFVGGKLYSEEDHMCASYRELMEETGILPEDIKLRFVRWERVNSNKLLYENDWEMFITYGVLNKDVKLKEEKNRLEWISLNDRRIDDSSMGFGNCRVFLNEAIAIENSV